MVPAVIAAPDTVMFSPVVDFRRNCETPETSTNSARKPAFAELIWVATAPSVAPSTIVMLKVPPEPFCRVRTPPVVTTEAEDRPGSATAEVNVPVAFVPA